MLRDLLEIIAALVLLSLVFYIPGHLVALATNVLTFRTRPLPMRAAIALCMSLAVVPAIFTPLAHFIPLQWLGWSCALLGLPFAALLVREGFRSLRSGLARSKPALIACTVWFLIALLSL